MPQFLISGYLPDNFDPSTQDPAIVEQIHALNREMIAAGVRKFACGLGPASTLRAQTNGDVLLTDGPYLEAKEHVGGFWILETADMNEALAWARKGAEACRASVEVRPIFFMPRIRWRQRARLASPPHVFLFGYRPRHLGSESAGFSSYWDCRPRGTLDAVRHSHAKVVRLN